MQIKCTQSEKDAIIYYLSHNEVCPAFCLQSKRSGFEGECNGDCANNIANNINWEIINADA